MRDFNNYPSSAQIIISVLLAIPVTAALISIVMIIFSLELTNYIATASLWSGIIISYLAARNNGGVKQIRPMLFCIFTIAAVSTLGTLRHIGLIDISPITLTRMFSSSLVLTGVSLTTIFGAKYIKNRRLASTYGVKEATIKIKIPIERDAECNGQTP